MRRLTRVHASLSNLSMNDMFFFHNSESLTLSVYCKIILYIFFWPNFLFLLYCIVYFDWKPKCIFYFENQARCRILEWEWVLQEVNTAIPLDLIFSWVVKLFSWLILYKQMNLNVHLFIHSLVHSVLLLHDKLTTPPQPSIKM